MYIYIVSKAINTLKKKTIINQATTTTLCIYHFLQSPFELAFKREREREREREM